MSHDDVRPIPVRPRWSWWLGIEYSFALGILVMLGYAAWFLHTYKYLPQPFFYEPSGTFMDWYSLTIWSHKPGAFDVERTIYPPLSFVVMRIFTISHCYDLTRSEEARTCDWLGMDALAVMLLVNVVLTWFTMRKIDRRTAIPRTIALGLGLPMVYGFERGNLLMFAYPCVILGLGPLLRSARLRWLLMGMAVNFKVYLISAVFAPLLRRQWRQFEGMIIGTVVVYLITWQILGEGSPWQIFRNLTDYSSGFGASSVLDLWYPSTYIPVTTFLNGTFLIGSVMGSREAHILGIVIPAFMHSAQLMILLAAAATWLRPEAVPPHRAVFLAISMALTSSEAGGYTGIFIYLFVLMEAPRGFGRRFAIFLIYILCIPMEVTMGKLPPIVRYSFLGHSEIIAQYGVGIMSLLRPGLVLISVMALSGATLRDVWQDIRRAGWSHRWRYRRDAPLLPGITPPTAP